MSARLRARMPACLHVRLLSMFAQPFAMRREGDVQYHKRGYASRLSIFMQPCAEKAAGNTIKRGYASHLGIGPVHLLRVSLLRVLESNFPGDSP